MERLVCIIDFECTASELLDRNALEYYKSGADDEQTLGENRVAFQRWLLRPRVLRDVSVRFLSTTVLGKPVAFPLGVSPSAMQKLAHPDGEIAMVKAVQDAGSIYILSTNSTCNVEEVAAAAPKARKWFQLYVFKDRKVSVQLVRRAEAAGFEALVLTVDAPLFGRRRNNVRNKFILPSHLRLSNFPSEGFNQSSTGSALNNLDALMDSSLNWEDLTWLKSITRLPLIVKGILCPEDALIALEHGASAIFVSNHGGRQLDSISATLDALPAVVEAVKDRCEVYLDGGVTTGADIFKALALGAKMVFVGRPALWGLAVGGQAGVRKVIEIYRQELDLVLALTGVTDVKNVSAQYLQRKSIL